MKKILTLLITGALMSSCSNSKIDKKGFQVNEIQENENGQKIVGLQIDSLKLETQPRNVLLTFNPKHRLTPIYKVNYDKKTKTPFIGSNIYHTNWNDNYKKGNNWNHNFMPGFEAVYGYNFVNVSHFNNETKVENKLFKKPVLIKTLYYPAFSNDTLNYKPINRNFYMVSAYDEDSNKDGFINIKDLRRFYHFDINGMNKKPLIPKEYSVMSSEYDSANDFMYVFAKKDVNKNGIMEINEPTEVFWINLKNPQDIGKQYQSE
ncbi:hypothetical protein F7018_18150 [Tenacibaculum aiptasiae]|uniref:EF-hand domain-containing protein n=1 Tax=Tenacibaculum aiptasiae TaxID=426481 RepID=A0A7J5A4S1_9FLAO|nr:hypothetical protein [Tenacibaculum aiptasiae]KAB1151410.1 hypothetical protein F7018_18150 [Tenacibaculum aiptasiae]